MEEFSMEDVSVAAYLRGFLSHPTPIAMRANCRQAVLDVFDSEACYDRSPCAAWLAGKQAA